MSQSVRQRNLFAAEDITSLWDKKRIARKLVKDCFYYNDDWDIRQILWHEFHDVSRIPVCQHEACNSHVKWNRSNEINLEKGQYNRFCSAKCAGSSKVSLEKRKVTSLEKYGVAEFLSSDEFQNKRSVSMKEKYGSVHALKNADLKEKMQATMQERYGVIHAMQNNELKEKAKQSCIERYGVSNPAQSEEIKNNLKRQVKEKYGVEFTTQIESMKMKSNETCINRYGFSNPLLSEDIRRKRNSTMMDRYGTIHALQNSQLKKKANDTRRKNGKIFESNFEKEIKDFLCSLEIEFEQHNYDLLGHFELDFYIPSEKLAIECNGDYWHSDKFKSIEYHYEKWKICRSIGVRLIQIWQSDWQAKTIQHREMILSALNKVQKGDPARKCQIQQIDAKQARPFLERYHLQGFVGGTSHWGAFDSNDNLVGVMTFGWTRGTKKSRRFELKRWATDDKTHAGLFSKVFKTARNVIKFDYVVSFSMNDWFTGNLYKTNGFLQISNGKPSYTYYYNNKRCHCSNFTKSRIAEKLPEFYDSRLTEREMMNNAGILRLWDAGKTEWIWESEK